MSLLRKSKMVQSN